MEFVRKVWLPDTSDMSKSTLAILGEFGSGKTLFCNKLVEQMASDYKPGNKISVLIRLGDIERYGHKNLKALLVEQIQTKFDLPSSTPTWREIKEIIQSDEIILIFDGLEEMTMKGTQFKMRDNFREILSTIGTGVKYIIACRAHYFSTAKEEKYLAITQKVDEIERLIKEEIDTRRLSIAYIEPFDYVDIRIYLNMKRQENLYQKIERFYNLADLAKRPIFLDLIVQTMKDYEFSGKVITGTELYRQYVEECFKREAKERKIGLSPEQQSQIVEEIAFKVYEKRRNFINRDLIEEVWNSMTQNKTEKAIEEFMRKYPFFRRADKAEKQLEFIHQSFLEFFVASRISRSIAKYKSDLYAAEYLTNQIDRYLYELLDRSGNIGIIVNWLKKKDSNVNLRMNCALTLGRSGRSNKEELIPKLKECLEKEKRVGDIGVAGRISEALDSLGDKKSLSCFLKNLKVFADRTETTGKSDAHRLLYDIVEPLENIDSEVINCLLKNLTDDNPRIRKYAVFMMGRTRTQTQKCVKGIIKCLKNPKETVRTRRYAAAALGIIGSTDALRYLKKVANKCKNESLRQECLNSIEKIEGHVS